jgi:DNA-binding PadR family transcriptional regulator
MKNLTGNEETVLLAVFRLGAAAHGLAVQRQIREVTGREYLYSTLYTTLEQLVRKGYLTRRPGDPSPRRGGKRRFFFRLTLDGRKALKSAFNRQKAVWQGITEDILG